jgi:hypothetical protein
LYGRQKASSKVNNQESCTKANTRQEDRRQENDKKGGANEVISPLQRVAVLHSIPSFSPNTILGHSIGIHHDHSAMAA